MPPAMRRDKASSSSANNHRELHLGLLVAAAKKLAARHRPLLALLFGKPLRALRGSGGRIGSAVGLLHCRLPRRRDLARDGAQLVEDDLQLAGVELLEPADLLFQPPEALEEAILRHSSYVPRRVTTLGSLGLVSSAQI